MRTLAVGDIHGCATAFDQLLEAIHLRPQDKLITLGDYVDKGPNSKGVLERLLSLYDNVTAHRNKKGLLKSITSQSIE